jgi:hypothetical protein
MVHSTQIMVEDLRSKIELVAEGVAGVNERLDLSRETAKRRRRSFGTSSPSR